MIFNNVHFDKFKDFVSYIIHKAPGFLILIFTINIIFSILYELKKIGSGKK